MEKHYVIVCVVKEDQVLLVLKDKPLWMAGRLNLPGGAVEDGETPEDAAVRELYEESGLASKLVSKMGEIRDGNNVIHCFMAVVNTSELAARESETQSISWRFFGSAMYDKRLLPNLRVIVPMIYCGLRNWVITDNYRGADDPTHALTITLPTYRSHDSGVSVAASGGGDVEVSIPTNL